MDWASPTDTQIILDFQNERNAYFKYNNQVPSGDGVRARGLRSRTTVFTSAQKDVCVYQWLSAPTRFIDEMADSQDSHWLSIQGCYELSRIELSNETDWNCSDND